MKRLFAVLSLAFIFSCGKQDELDPVITINSPTDNQVFTNSQTVNILATITDDNGIHMVHIMVLDNTNNGHLMHEEIHFDGKNYTLNKSFTAVAGKSYTIEVGATDHADNNAQKVLTVSAN